MKLTVGNLLLVVIFIGFLFHSCSSRQTQFNKSTEVAQIPASSEKSQAEVAQILASTEKSQTTVSENSVNVESCKTITDYNLKACIEFANNCGQIKEWAKKGVISETDPGIDKCKSKGWEFDN